MVDPGKLARLTLHPQDHAQQARSKALATAQQFEDVLVQTLVGALRKTTSIDGESGGMFGSDTGADTYCDWFDEKFAHEISRTGKVGIADVLMREFERDGQLAPAPGKAQAHDGAHDHAPDHAPDHAHWRAHRDLLDVDARRLQPLRLPPALTVPTLAAQLPHGGVDVAA
jgi:Rod binding domain-containing protein